MRVRMTAAALTLFVPGGIFADTPRTYAAAEAIWIQNRNTASYQGYAAEFSQFNNHFHLDEKDGCYALASGPVNLMLIISHPGNSQFAVIEQVLADVDNAKARCFEKSYRGLHTKIPPFLPFVLQMGMG
jgi:hypothetical protein